MDGQLLDKLTILAKSESGMMELYQARSKKEILSIMNKQGIIISEKELEEYFMRFSSFDEELDESMLETISGGNVSNTWRVLSIIMPYFNKT